MLSSTRLSSLARSASVFHYQFLLGKGFHNAPQDQFFEDRMRHQPTATLFANGANLRKYSTQLKQVPKYKVTQCRVLGDNVEVTFDSGEVAHYPKMWLRMHCQCVQCFNRNTGRSLLLSEWKASDTIKNWEVQPDGVLTLRWCNGHQAEYDSNWLFGRKFKEEKTKKYEDYEMIKQGWSKDHKITVYNFNDVMNEDETLLSWLEDLEVSGATKISGVSGAEDEGPRLAERVGMVKRTFYGEVSNVYLIQDANNLAYTGKTLDLHNDLAYNDELPGIIFLHMIKQHSGKGGDSLISDGFYAAEVLRRQHPEEFKTLSEIDVFFSCEGVDRNGNRDPYEYHRVNKGSVLTLDNSGEVKTIRYSNHSIDSIMDMPLEKVTPFINAFRVYGNLLMENSITNRLESGEILVLDNTRCQHGRTAIEGDSSRHLATCYMSWDEARCRRRVLQKKLKKTI